MRQHVRKSLDQHREQLAVTDRSSGSCLSLLLGGATAQVQGCWLGRGGWRYVQQAGEGTEHQVAAAVPPRVLG